jgi:hypothetical protein
MEWQVGCGYGSREGRVVRIGVGVACSVRPVRLYMVMLDLLFASLRAEIKRLVRQNLLSLSGRIGVASGT